MILEKQTEGLILEEGAISESTMMEIDADSHIFLMRMLSKFYSDAIGSLIRETASNALDSHRQSGSTEPIIVSLKRINGNVEFSVEDFGMGIDDHIVNTVIRMYGKSTKRQSANQLGAFGLGFKSPLAYGPSFCFIGRKDGIERKWMMYEAEDEQNKIDLLHEKPTTEKNGVKIIISVKYYDYSNFLSKIKEQLAYFEGVYFDCTGINNDFSIVRSEHFQWSPLSDDNEMHICLDNVYYPIDWSKLGIDRIYLPLGLRFSLSDGIFPLPNRESIKYTEECKKAIKDKISLVADHFIEKFNKEVADTDEVSVIFEYYSSSNSSVKGYDGSNWSISGLTKFSNKALKQPKLRGIKFLDLYRLFTMRDILAKNYKRAYNYSNGRFSDVGKSRWNAEMQYYNMDQLVYIYSDTLTKTKKDYFRHLLGKKSALFVKFEKEYPLISKISKTENSYKSILKLGEYPKYEWRARIKEFQSIRASLVKNFIDVDSIEVPKDWVESRKKVKNQAVSIVGTNARRKKLAGEITGKEAKDLERYVSSKNCKFESVVIKMAEAHKHPKMTIYAENTEVNESKFQQLFTLIDKKKIRLVTFSSRELKTLKDIKLHNWISMEDFEKGEHKVYRRLVTAYLINELMKDNYSTFAKKEVLESISKDLKSKLTDLVNYKNLYFTNGTEALYKEMLAVAEDKGLFDPSIYPLYKEIKKTLEKLPFLNSILKLHPTYGALEAPVLNALKDLFKYYKMRIDWIHYKVALNEESVEELTEETVEQLEETI